MFEAEELRKMLEASEGQLKAMILLGINGGFGNHDCATLPRSALNLDSGWVRFPRPKTGIDRRVPLWAETVDALRNAMKVRPKSKDEADEGLVFITKYGYRWVRTKPSTRTEGKLVASDSIAQEIRKLMKQLAISTGRNFYALRHPFETIGGDAKDQIAVDAIMGHAREDMASVYRERISDERLIAVTDHVRRWLLGDKATQAESWRRAFRIVRYVMGFANCARQTLCLRVGRGESVRAAKQPRRKSLGYWTLWRVLWNRPHVAIPSHP